MTPGVNEKVRRILLIILGCAFVASWIVPAARESQILCVRLLLHLSGKTVVQGQPPGCVIYIVPNVIFSDAHGAELLRRAGDSPDDYFRARAVRRDVAAGPPMEMWRGHPLIECAVASAMERLPHALPPAKGAPKAAPDLDARVQHATEIVALAQQTCPQNGALWLAEARLLFLRNANEEGLAACRTALQKGNWQIRSPGAVSYLKALLLASGLSDLDAMIEATAQCDRGLAMLEFPVQARLGTLMADAVRGGEREKFRDLLSLRREIRNAHWSDSKWKAFSKLTEARRLAEAMEVSAGRPALEKPKDHEKAIEEQSRIVHAYLATNFGEAFAESTLNEDEAAVARLTSERNHWQTDPALLLSGGLSTVLGDIALLLLSLLLTAFAIWPAVHLARSADAAGRPLHRSTRLIIASLAAIGVGTVLLTGWDVAVHQKVGLRGDRTPADTDLRIRVMHMLPVALGCLCISLWFRRNKNVQTVFAASAACVFVFYLACIFAMAITRAECAALLAKSML